MTRLTGPKNPTDKMMSKASALMNQAIPKSDPRRLVLIRVSKYAKGKKVKK
jgi:hypothetical protein